MRIRHILLALVTCAVLGASTTFGQSLQLFWNGGDGNFTDDNWVDEGGTSQEPFPGDSLTIPTGTVTIDTDVAADIGEFNELTIGDATLVVTTGGNVAFSNTSTNEATGNIFFGAPDNAQATLILEGNGSFSGASFRWASAAGSTGDVIIRDTASFTTCCQQDIIGFSTAIGAGTWTTVGSTVSLASNDDIWIGDDDVWIANITEPDAFSTAMVRDAFGFVGNGAVEVNLIGFDPQPGQRWRLIESRGEVDSGRIANGPLPATFTVGTELPLGLSASIISEDTGEIGYLDVELVNVLVLKVDTTTGNAYLENPASGALPLDVDGYTITSESGSLDASAFNGLADDGEAGWVPGLAPSQGPNRISEANFEGSTVFNGPGGGSDADFDGDGSVEGSDFLVWQQGGSPNPLSSEDLQQWEQDFGASSGGDGSSFALGAIFDAAGGTQDLAIEFTMTDGRTIGGIVSYDASGAPVSAVPEPASAILMGAFSLIGLLALRRRHRC